MAGLCLAGVGGAGERRGRWARVSEIRITVQGRRASGATGGALGQHWSSRRPGLHFARLCCCILAFTGNANGADSGLASNSLAASWLKPKWRSKSKTSGPAQPLGQMRATSPTQNDSGPSSQQALPSPTIWGADTASADTRTPVPPHSWLRPSPRPLSSERGNDQITHYATPTHEQLTAMSVDELMKSPSLAGIGASRIETAKERGGKAGLLRLIKESEMARSFSGQRTGGWLAQVAQIREHLQHGPYRWALPRHARLTTAEAKALEQRIATWAPAVRSTGQQQSCAQVMTRPLQTFNAAIAAETYGPDRIWENGRWTVWCTCLRHTEAAFDDALVHAYQHQVDGHGPPKRLVIFDIGANHGCACE